MVTSLLHLPNPEKGGHNENGFRQSRTVHRVSAM
jgi:hypothetical protein